MDGRSCVLCKLKSLLLLTEKAVMSAEDPASKTNALPTETSEEAMPKTYYIS